MSLGFNKIINDLLQILQEAGKNKTAPLDAQAEVRRVEGNTAWVHIAGGVDETPVRLTINARVGDKVQVRLSGGRAWITGNASAPPTDDHMANTANTTAKTANVTANQALQGANTAQNTADKAQSSADKAQGTANEAKTEMTEQKQFFYHDDEGAHVRDATNNGFRADLKSSGLYIVDTNTGKPSASFGATRCIIGGNSESKNLQITGDSVKINSGTYPLVNIRGLGESGQTVNQSAAFNGTAAWEIIRKNGMFEITYDLLHEPVSISSLKLFGDTKHITLHLNDPAYGYTITKNKLHIYADGNYSETWSVFWEYMDTLEITYTYSDLRGIIDTDVITLTEELSFAKGGEITYFDENNNVCGLIGITRGDGVIATINTGTVKSQPRWWRCGNIVQMEFTVAATASVASGSNIATGTIKGIPRPVTLNGLRSVSYYGDNANVAFVSRDGGFTVRNCGDDALASGNNAIGSFTYITDGYML